jgi:hypothetical protein
MLNTATTKQFRSTVREVCKRKNVCLGTSWTNGSPTGVKRIRGDDGKRTVGFYCNAANDSLAAIIERELKLNGLTADTRATDATDSADGFGSGYGGRYIRGTCLLG